METPGTEASTRKGGRRARGRLDSNKQEKVIKSAVIKDRKDELVRLHNAAKDAAAAKSDGMKAAAEAAGLQAAVVARYIAACAGENFEEKKRECEQLSILFEDVGE